VTFGYDNAGRLTGQQYSDGSRATFIYDGAGDRLTMQDGTGTQTFSYDEVRALRAVTYPGGKTLTYTYNEVGGRNVMLDPDVVVNRR